MTSDLHLTWNEILPLVSVHRELLYGEEVSDFCSLLMLADRILVAGEAEHTGPARLLTACLTELGFAAHMADCMTISDVTPDDTLIVVDVTGSDALWRLVKPALKVRPILLAVTAGTLFPPLAKQADATVSLPNWWPPSSRDQHMYVTGLQLMCFLIVDAIRLNLLQRTRVNWADLTRSSNSLGKNHVASTRHLG
jgi:DNA-binding MurR/RpiR family transcriptional regulator